ncbi:MAG TPA: hypothetical protein VF284_00900 [Rhodanobacteraceae bacterium]
MTYLVVALFVAGVALLIVGYRKSHRNLMLAAAIVLFLSATVGPFTQGFVQGLHGGWDGQSGASQ